MASTSFGGFTVLGEETETAARMLLLPTMTGGGGFIGDIPRGGLGEEAVD